MKILHCISKISLIVCVAFFMTAIVCAQKGESEALDETIRATAVGEISLKNSDNLEKSALLNRSWSTGESLNRPSLDVSIGNQGNSTIGGSSHTVSLLYEDAPLLSDSVMKLETEIGAIVKPETQEKGWFGRFMDAGGAAKDSVIGGLIDVAWLGSNGIASHLDRMKKNPAEPLSRKMKTFAKRLYGDSLDVSLIKVQRNSLMEHISACPHVSGNTIFMPDKWGGRPLFNEDGSLTQYGTDIMNHEIAHVWQYQNGGSEYINKALLAQHKSNSETGSRSGAYRWRNYYRAGVPFEKLNPEAQATLIEEIGDVYVNGARTSLERALNKVKPTAFDNSNSREVNKIIKKALEDEKGKSEKFKKELAYMLNAWANVRNGLGAPRR
ncbi:MAG: hypothetical protein KAR84_04500 [Elusimicrobiales bacterium]|nr:hypothetical protein [Elusimicrobiales bacterium]MCK5584172.1 hypothetical protein [Elusimicrobiales bacterium]